MYREYILEYTFAKGCHRKNASAEQLAGKVVEVAESKPLALKRGHIFKDLTARLKSCPSQTSLGLEFFRKF